MSPGERLEGGWGPYGRVPVLALAAVAFIDSVDRGILPGVVSLVQRDLGLSDAEAGVLGSVFVFMTFLAVIPAGYVADRLRRTRVVALTLASWGAISAVNALVRSFGQFVLVRAALGIGDSVNGPSAQSLVADYYPAPLRPRAYAWQRVAPTLGYAMGLAVGGAVGSTLGWRKAFLVVGVPGSLLALGVWRLPEPPRGAIDRPGPGAEKAGAAIPHEDETSLGPEGGSALFAAVSRRGGRAMARDVATAAGVRSLRAIVWGTAISTGATAGIAFWAAAFYERHTTLGVRAASTTVGAIILLGAASGTILGGRVAARLRARHAAGPMWFAGATQAVSALVLAVTFLHEPIAFRLGGQVVGVALLVAAFPALAAVASEVVPPTLRGTAFALTGFLAALASALSPLLIGAVADRFPIVVSGRSEGNLAAAFAATMPLVFLGGLVVLRGGRHVPHDLERVRGRAVSSGRG